MEQPQTLFGGVRCLGRHVFLSHSVWFSKERRHCKRCRRTQSIREDKNELLLGILIGRRFALLCHSQALYLCYFFTNNLYCRQVWNLGNVPCGYHTTPKFTFVYYHAIQRSTFPGTLDIYCDHLFYCFQGAQRIKRFNLQVIYLAKDLSRGARHPVVERRRCIHHEGL